MENYKIYEKTERYNPDEMVSVQITEKLDGSNLAIGNIDGELYIFQRKFYYHINEAFEPSDKLKGILYKGIVPWLKENHENLKSCIKNNHVIFGEYMGMSKFKKDFDMKYYTFGFAKNFRLENGVPCFSIRNFKHNQLGYAFTKGQAPDFIGTTPLVKLGTNFPSIKELDEIYDKYCKEVNRNVEGFILTSSIQEGTPIKYVRRKNGKLEDHYFKGQGVNKQKED